MAKTRSQRITSSIFAFHLVGVLGLAALGCGGSSGTKSVDARKEGGGGTSNLDARNDGVATPGDTLVATDTVPSDTKITTDGDSKVRTGSKSGTKFPTAGM